MMVPAIACLLKAVHYKRKSIEAFMKGNPIEGYRCVMCEYRNMQWANYFIERDGLR